MTPLTAIEEHEAFGYIRRYIEHTCGAPLDGELLEGVVLTMAALKEMAALWQEGYRWSGSMPLPAQRAG